MTATPTAPEPPRRGRGRPRLLPADAVPTMTRLPRELHGQLAAEAAAAGMSLDRWIARRLAEAVATTPAGEAGVDD